MCCGVGLLRGPTGTVTAPICGSDPFTGPSILDDAQLRRAVPLAARARLVVALRVLAPNAIRPIEDLVPLLYPGVKVSYGTIQQMLVEAEGRAARFSSPSLYQAGLGVVDRHGCPFR